MDVYCVDIHVKGPHHMDVIVVHIYVKTSAQRSIVYMDVKNILQMFALLLHMLLIVALLLLELILCHAVKLTLLAITIFITLPERRM